MTGRPNRSAVSATLTTGFDRTSVAGLPPGTRLAGFVPDGATVLAGVVDGSALGVVPRPPVPIGPRSPIGASVVGVVIGVVVVVVVGVPRTLIASAAAVVW